MTYEIEDAMMAMCQHDDRITLCGRCGAILAEQTGQTVVASTSKTIWTSYPAASNADEKPSQE